MNTDKTSLENENQPSCLGAVSRRVFIIVAIKYGQNGNLCFWRANDSGYTNDLSQAGRYPEELVRSKMDYYHNGETIAIEECKLLTDFQHRITVDTNYQKIRKYILLSKRKMLSVNES